MCCRDTEHIALDSIDEEYMKMGLNFRRTLVVLGSGMILPAAVTGFAASPSALLDERPFLTANQGAMDKMMADMAIRPSGDVDEDFAGMMIPHHKGAIEMARAELLYGRNEQLQRIAQEIIIDQQQEIVAMRLALGQPSGRSKPAPDQVPERE